MPVISVERLVKKYGRLEAVKEIGFSVEENEIFGMVGPNGAGKTTTIECIEGAGAGRCFFELTRPGTGDTGCKRRGIG